MDEFSSKWMTTCWDSVAAASTPGRPDHDKARDRFVALYYGPLYACLRYSGLSPDDAKDVVQDFFAEKLWEDVLPEASPERWKLRNFLKRCLLNLGTDARRKNQRRVGPDLSFDDAEIEHCADRCTSLTPEQYLDRRFAIKLMDEAFRLVREKVGDKSHFDALRGQILHEDPSRVMDVAERLGLKPNAVHQSLSRWRRMWGSHFRSLVCEELGLKEGHPESEAAITDEIRYFLKVTQAR